MLLPLPMCHALWTALVNRAPCLRNQIWGLPIDDFDYVHRLLGTLSIGCVGLGASVWLATMVPACLSGGSGANACLAFARGGSDGVSFDPVRNVVILRLIVAPLWGTVLPLMAFAGTSWQTFEATLSNEHRFGPLLNHHLRHPIVAWLGLVGVASGLAAGVWATGKLGAAVGSVFGLCMP